MIECVPNSRSREDIGRNTEAGLFEYYQHLYGKVDSTKFQNVKRIFSLSKSIEKYELFRLDEIL